LLSPVGAPHPYYIEQGWGPGAGAKIPLPTSETTWKAETKGPLSATSPVVMSWDNGQGLVFRRTITVDEHYMFSINDEVQNKSGAPVTLLPYSLIRRHGTPKIEGIYILHEGLIGVVGNSGLLEIAYSTLLGEIDKSIKANPANNSAKREYKAAEGGWLGITDKYWATALVPGQSAAYDARLWAWKDGTQPTYQTDFVQPAVTVAPGGTGKAEARVFAGAKDVHVVDGYRDKFAIKQFDSIIDWGTFWYITKPLYQLLEWINRHVGNFGVAILIVTVLVKLLFFPLANKSYESMARMKKLQPEMERIRDRHKDDKARQQQEMMALYQKEKINPVAGCLPILVQIPVFFALYKVLFVSISMRHAPFFGWIKDLSAPDPTSVFNLFGLLPVPAIDAMLLGHTIGAWAILMGFTMWLQMQLNPQQPDPMQQAIFNWMPVIFTIMLGGFASGLVIYWAWSNILSIAQQWLIMKKNGVEGPLVDNLKRNFANVKKGVGALATLAGLKRPG
jgi:YidC/Oxa1 family membrane protein insertase